MDAPVSLTLPTLHSGCSGIIGTVNPAAMDAPVSATLSTLQLWMFQCQWHCQSCSYGCSSVSDTVNPAAMDAPMSVTLSTLQLWMLQCQWHCQPCSYGCSDINDTVNPAAMDAPVSLTLEHPYLQGWLKYIPFGTTLHRSCADVCTSEAHSMHARHRSHTKVCCKSVIWILHAKYKVSCKNDDFKYHSVIIWIYYTQSIQG